MTSTASSAAATAANVSITLHGDDLSWLDLMLTGALPARYERPADGSLPVTLRLTPEQADAAQSATTVTLLDPEGVSLARVLVSTIEDGWLEGAVEELTGFSHLDHVEWRVPPAKVAQEWPDGPVIALWQTTPVPLSVREATRALARSRGGQVLELVGVPSGRETSRAAHLGPRLAKLETTRDPDDRAIVVPAPSLGDSTAAQAARVSIASTYGATILAVPPGQSPPVEIAEAASQLGVEIVTLDLDPRQAGLTPEELDALLAEGALLPDWYAEPAVADEIRRLHHPRSSSGLTVLLSGLSGSGKSTVARALAVRLMETEVRSVSLLDGDVVRHHLSKGLGFARADRDTNVRRIGFVASEITKAGGIAICCPIAPYDEMRKDVRAMVEAEGGFVLVHVATPLEECERRDRKGLYAKARRGEIPEFTGISDPYEVPQDAEAVIDTTGRTIDSCVDEVLATLRKLGYVA